jgi:hypothetical protein
MKKAVGTLFVSMMILGSAYAQDVTTVQAMSSDISDHLDLEAVAAVFAESENLEDFERRLNDPESRLSNLDMNEDGYVDYLRVMENADADARLITIQAVVGKDLYQDVATIDVDVDERGQPRVQVVGDVYMYGPDYIIEPVYHYRPRIFVYLWAPRINPWCSAFSWGFYPSYWSYWAPYSYYNYYSHIHSYHYYGYTSYYYRSYRRSASCAAIYHRTARQDYAHHHPYRSFTARNDGYRNKRALETSRPASYYTASNTKGTSANTKDMATANSRPASQWNTATASNQNPALQTKDVRSDKGGNNVVSQRPLDNSRPQVKQDWTKPSASSSRDETASTASATRPSATNTIRPNAQSNNRPSSTQRPQADAPRQQPSALPQGQTTSRPSSTERPKETSRPSSSSMDNGSQARPSSSSSRGTASQPSRSSSSSRSTAGSSSSSSRGSSSAPNSAGSSNTSSKKR